MSDSTPDSNDSPAGTETTSDAETPTADAEAKTSDTDAPPDEMPDGDASSDEVSDAEATVADDEVVAADVPDWDDEYVDRVSDRLMHNYDLEKDRTVRSEQFSLYGRLEVHSQKHFFHPMLSFGHHDAREHLFVHRTESATVAAAERLVELGHELADEWVEADEEHYSTDFTFVLVVPTIPAELREFVAEFRDRTMLKYGYYGHYEINLVAVAPEDEEIVASEEATVEEAFRLWDPIEKDDPGLLRLIARRFQI